MKMLFNWSVCPLKLMKVGHCTVSMSRDDTYEEGREWRRTSLDRFLSSTVIFCVVSPDPPRATEILVEIHKYLIEKISE